MIHEHTLGQVTLSKEEYDRLVERDRQLNLLDDAGVDNWEYNYVRYMTDEEYQKRWDW